MTEILTHATDAELAAAIEDNLFALFRATTQLPGSELVEDEQFSYHDTPLPSPIFKGVWRAKLAPDQTDTAIEQMITHYQARNSPLAGWWFNDQPQPPDLVERLLAHGFELSYIALGMALDLNYADAAYRVPEGLEIVEATDEQTLNDWATTLYHAYDEEFPLASARVFPDATLTLGADCPWRAYIGYWNGQPAATNLVFVGGGVAGLFCVGTIPGLRGKGIGAAITLKPLLDARALGYHYGVLFASEMGIPMYRKIGFRPVGIDIGRCVWVNEQP